MLLLATISFGIGFVGVVVGYQIGKRAGVIRIDRAEAARAFDLGRALGRSEWHCLRRDVTNPWRRDP
jgi:hypothetical protein